MRHISLNSHTAVMASVALVLVGGLPVQAAETDSKIESSAKNSYNFKTYLKDDNIKVSSTNGVVTLTGTVARDYHKTLAEETVAGLPGVKNVDNRLTLVGDQPSEHSDAWITMKVKAVLAFHKNVSATDTEVNTENGIVTLSGKADSEAQKQLTAEYAKDVDGVTEVRNELVAAKPGKLAHRSVGAKVDDTSITAQVKTALLFHKSTHALATKVVTRDGVVTLHGQATNAAERDLVTKLAEDVHGVTHVNNRMTVQ
ncbi:BON domain-containing protein [Geothrix fuzhouensis]|uniref:BON domain-containing protein n=1 Tax=Geothrix fuzhouensis TaxID=2966451 RepID=UPI0021485354|nr:BON domain-containing protein [Geothrix fuzhouensis]